jgi:hypothetical protein
LPSADPQIRFGGDNRHDENWERPATPPNKGAGRERGNAGRVRTQLSAVRLRGGGEEGYCKNHCRDRNISVSMAPDDHPDPSKPLAQPAHELTVGARRSHGITSVM